ncbi:MAG: hypothetical protein IKN91_08540 [Paludibacteraceae bacterium]|nr:hypothetical protein [Paludibacteraceae bacterium]
MKIKIKLSFILLITLLLSNCSIKKNISHDCAQANFLMEQDTLMISFNDFIMQNLKLPPEIDIMALFIIKFDVIENGKIDNILITSNCDICNQRLYEVVKLSSPYWKLEPCNCKKGKSVHYEYKYIVL